ncbi:cx9C motif-containing protein 4 [Uranotaenia lowii]|uniref:cx9C motif-containing protein 4 n=1 Tax=Uranotaenia lowii TaxID=190385 RepID=UPI002478DC1B|nr:cx9C motif-containing protein 4 [Uranotaenia lowii]
MSSKTAKDPCKPSACRIQDCLKANKFDETRCYDVIENMRQCCLKFHKVSLCCSGIKLDRDYHSEQEAADRERQEKHKQRASE